MSDLCVGIFVGGRGSRLGGVAKGLLCDADGIPLVKRLEAVCRTAFPAAPITLVGRQAAYDHLQIASLEDDPAGVGPLGGLRTLLAWSKIQGASQAIAVAGDMPFLTADLLQRLATWEPRGKATAPKRNGHWEPLCARYRIEVCLPLIDDLLAREQRALFRVLEQVQAAELELSPAERALLVDWDTPADVARDRS